ncbi:hedgehog signaling/DD-peptidase zinc-binding domain protein [Vibrio phage 1.199.A._10N.286.55.C10]|nr:hedgehog signaling/DD-peptidase zinc-binding domain protein [Vibrio phage 1.149.O._10N.286.55.A12]AUR94886.1 hedgehog signaling/DD-peptidase zinc-binding domain protein [Vibrio phage 1.199.A._10N.286.55.C10]AUR94963.1 hedgehog signaling/DD-peptidase zinc-binding domain protein [Vibrio phage 1.199.B._10N.286.55.C10]AUR98237.1 hedgehog signaling/DD-peptidase zinc-binding domain protein [Vibrio phage 1.248.O._10N.261.54.F1]AUS00759.1 hedgehog signaling/DD-peptidase zinc-binding domain protein [
MRLSEKQRLFTKCISELINYAYAMGYELTLGDAYRDPRVHGQFGEKKSYSASRSVHKMRLAMDFNLFVDGKYIADGDHPAYKDLGEFWEGMNEFSAWGGRFKDANHFSFEHEGVK